MTEKEKQKLEEVWSPASRAEFEARKLKARLGVCMPKNLRNSLEAIAQRQYLKLSDIVRIALREYVERHSIKKKKV